MNITEIASKMFLEKISGQGGDASLGSIQTALQHLLPTDGGEINVGSLVSQFMGNGGLASLAQSWLGDGQNMSLSADKIMDMFGESKVSNFANEVGVDTNTAANGLSDMIPDLIDKFSSGGSLQQNLTSSIIGGLAGKFFK
ncbi:YidB family protein [Halioxenophilus aromaticivorans]|uniref:DUF937 domain-containing protein n=1 Tax=Halioxenophilus aromaticivorans TaxID=1306992 RepID=A0AAV3U7W8_9ALTE